MKSMTGPQLARIIGANIRRYRIERREPITQAELASEIGLTQPHLSMIESGKVSPSIATLAAIADVLEVPPHFLLSEEAVAVGSA